MIAKRKAEKKKKQLEAQRVKKIAEAKRRQQQLARSKAHIRVTATLNGRPLKTSFVLTKNGKHVQTIPGRSNANFTVKPGRYILKTQYGGKVATASVIIGAFETVIQQFAFKGSAPQKSGNLEHEHKAN